MMVHSGAAIKLKRCIVIGIAVLMAGELVFAVLEAQWLNAALILSIGLLVSIATVFSDRIAVQLPAEFEVLALIFAFAALFLGEVKSYYDRFWWWDIALHTAAGLLMGILGFLLVYVLNESKRVDLALTPRFIAIFAFLFAVTVGALWEIFEFAVDGIFKTRMQKPMFSDPSGLTDTMWDMIVNAIGASVISVSGWWYIERRRESFIDVWIEKFIQRNPALFRA